ncbi:hypothetical protein SKAU_G00103800 [Synaphobranchus kaupii]|uniref:Uncharacterized protein n=1 Tax=Synaphobranchus kaupii TaxID=118154 RepID=A0A9Q1J6M3_SYNKA|nr:hypothetical protein SKAU_G00103800 [Synaphobranchus kaupii]
MRFRSQEDEKMGPMQCIHWLIFSISLLLSITLSASSTILPSPLVQSTSQKYRETGGSSTAAIAISPSLAQDGPVTMVISASSIQTDTITMSTSPSFSQDSPITTMIPISPTKDNSTDMATTPLNVTTDVAQTTGLTTTANSPTTQAQLTPLLTSTSVPTSQSAQTTVTAMTVSIPTSQSAQTTVTAMSVSVPTETNSTMEMVRTQGPQLGLTRSEVGITMFCGVVLGLTILIMVGYNIHRCQRRKAQYIHQPLYNSSEETVDRFPAPDDTLVISGGLYDGPESFTSALTTDEDTGFHSDQPPFAPQPTHFRLEFLSEEQQRSPACGASTFETFQPFDAEV